MRFLVFVLAASLLSIVVPESASAQAGSPTSWSARFAGAGPDDDLIIGASEWVELDVCSVRIASLVVEGQWTLADGLETACPQVDVRLNTLLVRGEGAVVEFGRSDRPFSGRLLLELGGDIAGPAPGMAEQRQIMVMGGARLALFGISGTRQSWTQLAQNARIGTDRIRVADATGWQPGDRVVVASSTIDPREAEVVEIVAVASDGRTFFIAPELRFDHSGKVQHYGGKRLDSRAEVGLLSHSIVIRGDEHSSTTGIGGNIMVMNEAMERPEGHPADLPRPVYAGIPSTLVMDGVELMHMGQRGRPGRYSIHWHLVDDGSGSQVRDTSIHHGFQRAINVHGTDRVTIERVVGFHVENHMFVVSEEGDEVRNRFIDNLGILTLPPLDGQFAFPRSDNPNRSEQSEERPAVFWLRTSFNTLHGNHAAGAWRGQGFFYDHGGMNGRSRRFAYEASGSTEMCDFRDNLAHSIYIGLGSPDWYTPLVRGFGIFSNGHQYQELPTTCTLRGFTAYMTQNGGAWLEEHTVLDDAIITDSHTGVIAGDQVNDVVVVGRTANPMRSGGLPGKADLPHPDRSRGGFAQSNNGAQGIEGRRLTRLSCYGLPTCFFAQTGSNGTIGQLEGATLDQVDLVATPQGFATEDGPALFSDPASMTFGTFRDLDGALTGVGGAVGAIDDPVFLATPNPPPNRWGWLWTELPRTQGDGPGVFDDGFE